MLQNLLEVMEEIKDTQILYFFIEMPKVITFSNKLTTNI
jgi:hypothetical protein